LRIISQDNDKAPERLARLADEISRMRDARNRQLPADLLGEPAWDILLALYREGVSACRRTDVYRSLAIPEATADRWIAALEKRGLLAPAAPGDSASEHLSLTASGKLILERALGAMLRVTHS
jgi:DNA-binding MarR family transcriptional regulator